VKLTLSRSDPDQADWLDRSTLDQLHRLAAPLGETDDTVEVVVVGDEFIRKINNSYRNIDRATNVISFSYLEEGFPCGENVAGEMYISYETVEKEANEQAVDPKHLFLRISIHGLLHVLGYDHQDDGRHERMEREEKRILSQALEPDQVEALF
jgi:probable rRNA maturation factor